MDSSSWGGVVIGFSLHFWIIKFLDLAVSVLSWSLTVHKGHRVLSFADYFLLNFLAQMWVSYHAFTLPPTFKIVSSVIIAILDNGTNQFTDGDLGNIAREVHLSFGL